MRKQRKKPVEIGGQDCLTIRCPHSTELQEKQCAHLFTQPGESKSTEKRPEPEGQVALSPLDRLLMISIAI